MIVYNLYHCDNKTHNNNFPNCISLFLALHIDIQDHSEKLYQYPLYPPSSSKMISNLLKWQPLTVLIFSMFFLGSFLSIFFFLKILFYGTRLTAINGLYALSFLTMGLVVPSYVRQKKNPLYLLQICFKRVFFFMKLELLALRKLRRKQGFQIQYLTLFVQGMQINTTLLSLLKSTLSMN